MSSVVLQFPADTEQKLREQASRAGQTLETYLVRLAEEAISRTDQMVENSNESEYFISDPNPTNEEFDRLLRALVSGPPLPVLPPDFSRADIYDDHD